MLPLCRALTLPRVEGVWRYFPLYFRIWNSPPRYVGGEAYINLDASRASVQSSRRRCSAVLEALFFFASAFARVRRHGLKRYVRARALLGFCFSVGLGRRSYWYDLLVLLWREAAEKGGRGRPMSPSCFHSSEASHGVGRSFLRSPFF